MAANETELRALMRASVAGDALAHRTLLSRLSASLRAYYKSRHARGGRSATDAEDLMEAQMRTEDLISMLSTNVEPVDHRRVGRNIGMAVAAGAAVAVATVFFVLGPRADLTTVGTSIPPLLKVAFTVIILVPASIYLIRLTRPGGERRSSAALVALPFIAIMLLVVLRLGFAPSSPSK